MHLLYHGLESSAPNPPQPIVTPNATDPLVGEVDFWIVLGDLLSAAVRIKNFLIKTQLDIVVGAGEGVFRFDLREQRLQLLKVDR